jgi:hypothetical protein
MNENNYYSFIADNPGYVHLEFYDGKPRSTYEYLSQLCREGWKIEKIERVENQEIRSNTLKFHLSHPHKFIINSSGYVIYSSNLDNKWKKIGVSLRNWVGNRLDV